MALPLRWLSLGDSAGAHRHATELEKRFGEDTSVRFAYLPEIRGLLSMGHDACEGD